MNRSKLKEILGDAATDEVVNAIMQANGNDVNAAKGKADQLKAQLEEANASIDALNKANESTKGEEAKWQQKIDAANKAAAKAMHALNEQSAVAVFAKAGISEEQYTPLLSTIVTDDQEKTVEAAQAIASMVSAKVDAAVADAKKQSLGGMKPPEGGSEPGSVTSKKAFREMSEAEQVAWKSQNPDAWKKLS